MSMDKKTRGFKRCIQEFIKKKIMKPYFYHKFNCDMEKIEGLDGPALILANHVTNMDPFLIGVDFDGKLIYVCAENITRNKLLFRFVDFMADVIVHNKNMSGIRTLFFIKKHIKSGESVLLFPEGNRSFDGETIDVDYEGLIKFMASLNACIVTYRLEGGYLTTPRWSTTARRGRMRGRVMNVYSSNLLKADVDACANGIHSDLYVNAFKDQKTDKVCFKGKNLALGMESLVYMCPECKSFSSLVSEGDYIKCSCGLCFQFNEYGELVNENKLKLQDFDNDFNLVKWNKLQKNTLFDMDVDSICFPLDNVVISCIDDNHKVSNEFNASLIVKKGIIKVCKCSNDNLDNSLSDNNIIIDVDLLSGVSIFLRNVLTVYYNDIQYEINGDMRFNAVKYFDLYTRLKKERE